MKTIDQSDETVIAAALRRRLAELLDRSGGMLQILREPLVADSEDQAIMLADDDALTGVDTVLQDEIADIREALARLERDEYGFCDRCGEPIAADRLQALPTAATCIGCASVAGPP